MKFNKQQYHSHNVKRKKDKKYGKKIYINLNSKIISNNKKNYKNILLCYKIMIIYVL